MNSSRSDNVIRTLFELGVATVGDMGIEDDDFNDFIIPLLINQKRFDLARFVIRFSGITPNNVPLALKRYFVRVSDHTHFEVVPFLRQELGMSVSDAWNELPNVGDSAVWWLNEMLHSGSDLVPLKYQLIPRINSYLRWGIVPLQVIHAPTLVHVMERMDWTEKLSAHLSLRICALIGVVVAPIQDLGSWVSSFNG